MRSGVPSPSAPPNPHRSSRLPLWHRRPGSRTTWSLFMRLDVGVATHCAAHPAHAGWSDGMLRIRVSLFEKVAILGDGASSSRSNGDGRRSAQLPPGEESGDADKRHQGGDDEDGAKPGYRSDLARDERARDDAEVGEGPERRHRGSSLRRSGEIDRERLERGLGGREADPHGHPGEDDRRDPGDRVERAEAQAVDDDDADPSAEALRETLEDAVVADGLRAPRDRDRVRDVRARRGGERAERHAAEHGRKHEKDRHATADWDRGPDRQREDERDARDDHHRGAAEREEPRAVAVAPGTDRETGHERAGRLDPDDRANDLGTQTEFPNDKEPDGGVHEHQAGRLRERGEPDEDESDREDAVGTLRGNDS